MNGIIFFLTKKRGMLKMSECKLCNIEFTPRSSGGSYQKFCSKKCRHEYDRICRKYGHFLVENNNISIEELIKFNENNV